MPLAAKVNATPSKGHNSCPLTGAKNAAESTTWRHVCSAQKATKRVSGRAALPTSHCAEFRQLPARPWPNRLDLDVRRQNKIAVCKNRHQNRYRFRQLQQRSIIFVLRTSSPFGMGVCFLNSDTLTAITGRSQTSATRCLHLLNSEASLEGSEGSVDCCSLHV